MKLKDRGYKHRLQLFLIATVAETHLRFLRGQVEYLQSIGFSVTLVASPGPQLDACRSGMGVRCVGIGMTRRMSPFSDLLSLIRLWWLLLWERPAIVQYSTPKAALLSSLAATLAGIRCRIFLVRGSVSAAERGWSTALNRWAEWLTVRLSAEVICVSPTLRAFLRNQGVLREKQGVVIENGMSNGVDTSYFKGPGLATCQTSGGRQPPIIGMVGRLNREKGIEDFAKAWKVIRQDCPQARVLLVGRWDSEAAVSPWVRRLFETDPRVEIVGEVDDVRPFLRRMTVFCFPSHREGFPNAPMEAAAMRVPVVAVDVVGSVDAVRNGVTGAVVPKGDAGAIAAAVLRYLRNPELAESHGKAGRERVDSDFKQRPIWQGFGRCYRTVFVRACLKSDGWWTRVKTTVGRFSASQRNIDSERRVGIIGAGGHARVIISCLRKSGKEPTKIFDDDSSLWGTSIDGLMVVGGVDRIPEEGRSRQAYIIAIGDNRVRSRIAKKLNRYGVRWATAIHPNAIVDESVDIGAGTAIFAGAIIQSGASIGEHAIVNTSASIDHECVIGSFAHIAPAATLAGNCAVAEGALVGAGSTVLPALSVGCNAIVGAGATVTRVVPDGSVVIGCPARAQPESPPKAGEPSGQWPVFDDEQIAAVAKVLKSGKVNYWTGAECKEFEREFAEYIGVRHGIAVANGTVALELALAALGIGPGDDVIVPSRTFIATASAVVMSGGRPIVADIDPISQNITADTIQRVLTPRTRAIVVVHLGGWPCDMTQISLLARERGLFVIEDCAQAHGAKISGQPVGSFGHIAAFSFCQDKIISTAGEGGMVVTNDRDLWKKAWSIKDHGKDFDLVQSKGPAGQYRFLHRSFGTNWRMTEVQAAVGRIQLRRLEKWTAERRENSDFLRTLLKGCPALQIPNPPEEYRHAFYRLYESIQLEQLKAEWTRDRVITRINELGGNVGCGSCGEIYREGAFADTWSGVRLPGASLAHETSLAFLVNPGLSRQQLKRTAEATIAALREATGKCDASGLKAA